MKMCPEYIDLAKIGTLREELSILFFLLSTTLPRHKSALVERHSMMQGRYEHCANAAHCHFIRTLPTMFKITFSFYFCTG